MQYLPDGTEIVLWGIGRIGREIIEGVYGNYNISFAIDNKVETGKTDQIENITVYSTEILENNTLKNGLMILGIYYWQDIAIELEKRGKHIFNDYLPYCYLKYETIDIGFLRFCSNDNERRELLKKLSFGKKLCGLYGFCHMYVYKPLLLRSKQFTEEYCLLDLPTANHPFELNYDLLSMPYLYSLLDLLILGFIYPGKEYGTPNWGWVKSWVNEKCKVILVTNAVFTGYFPQQTVGIKDKIRWGDKNVNKMIEEGKTAESIVQILSEPDFYSVEDVNSFYENALRKMERNEAKCDIKISDYIRKYGRQKVLMYSSIHPLECVMKELAIRIFKELKLDVEVLETMPESEIYSFKIGTSEFIYPSVYKALRIAKREDDEKLYINGTQNDPVTFSEYVNLYVENYKK